MVGVSGRGPQFCILGLGSSPTLLSRPTCPRCIAFRFYVAAGGLTHGYSRTTVQH